MLSRTLATALVAVGLLPAPSAADDAGDWLTALNTRCAVWNPRPQVKETVTWSGACEDGKAEGEGELVWRYEEYGRRLESRYLGPMKAGRMHGPGVLDTADGAEVTGTFVDGFLQGDVTVRWSNGNRYEGEFENSVRQGEGRFVWFDGEEYRGPWVADRKHGRGECRRSADTEPERCCFWFGRPAPCKD